MVATEEGSQGSEEGGWGVMRCGEGNNIRGIVRCSVGGESDEYNNTCRQD